MHAHAPVHTMYICICHGAHRNIIYIALGTYCCHQDLGENEGSCILCTGICI